MGIWPSTTTVNIDPKDCDGYGHLNNKRGHPKYFELAIDNFNKMHGLHSSQLMPQGFGYLIKKNTFDYIEQVKLEKGSKLEIKSRFKELKKARLFVEQAMFQEGVLVCRCESEFFFYDINKNRPIRIPQEHRDLISTSL